ncbi:MAG: endonuclease [Elusimicrobiota bacterium]|jgi:hypothetical protein
MSLARRPAWALLFLFVAAASQAAPRECPVFESLLAIAPGPPAVITPPGFAPAPLPPLAAESGAGLLASLHELSGRGFRQHEYGEASNQLFSVVDSVERNGRRGVVDAYSGVFVPGTSTEGADYRESGDQNADGFVDSKGMNVEHTWPQAFFSKRLPMKSDLHHLLATFIHPNGVRGSMPFGEVRGSGEYRNNGGAKAGGGVFEPPDAAKGRVARAVLYFYTRYYDRNITNGVDSQAFWNSKLEMLLRWNRSFPPDELEKKRNSAVERFQGNRNPFIDDPSLADRVGVSGFQRASRWDAVPAHP